MSAAPRRSRAALRLGVLAAACAGLIVLGVSAAADGMSYYRTPSELTGAWQPGDDVRLGGTVVPGSLAEAPDSSSLTVTDGASEVTVRYPGRFPDVVREGEGTIIDGTVGADGAVDANTIVLRHSNEYESGEYGPGELRDGERQDGQGP